MSAFVQRIYGMPPSYYDEDFARSRIGKWLVTLPVAHSVLEWFGIETRTVFRAVVDDFGNLVRVPS
jgi:hypothetical protein